MRLQHFAEKGLDLSHFAEAELSRLFLTSYIQDSFEPFPDLDLNKELDIALRFDRTFRRIPLQVEPIVLESGYSPQAIRRSFYDSVHEENRSFYMYGWTHYDVWGESEEMLARTSSPGFTDEEWQQVKEQRRSSLLAICPEGKNLARIEYEVEGDIRLDFYAKDYLDAKPLSALYQSPMSVAFGPTSEKSDVRKRQKAMIGPIDKTFNGSLVVELLSYHAEFPEITIEL